MSETFYCRTECQRCGRTHRTWHVAAKCRWKKGLCWVAGNPPAKGPCFALVSYCHHPAYRSDYVTVTLWRTRPEAENSKRMIDGTGCGGSCSRRHYIYRGAGSQP
jgi:hypothetical protein